MERWFQAIRNKDLEGVTQMISEGFDVNTFSDYGSTGLISAIIPPHTAVIELLVANGADVDLADMTMGYSPVVWAAINGYDRTLDLLLGLGATPSIPEKVRDNILKAYQEISDKIPDTLPPLSNHSKDTIQKLLELTKPLTDEEKRILKLE